MQLAVKDPVHRDELDEEIQHRIDAHVHLAFRALLGKEPGRPIREEEQQRAASLAAYGVAFHACGNTMKALGWGKEDLHDFVEVVPIGADDLMLLQEQGYQYLAM